MPALLLGVVATLLLSPPALADDSRITNCGEPAIEAEWRDLIEEMGKISAAERRDAIAVNKMRHAICEQVEEGELNMDEGIALFEEERERWRSRTRLRKQIESSGFAAG